MWGCVFWEKMYKVNEGMTLPQAHTAQWAYTGPLSPASVGRAIRGPDQPQVPSTLLQVGTPRD